MFVRANMGQDDSSPCVDTAANKSVQKAVAHIPEIMSKRSARTRLVRSSVAPFGMSVSDLMFAEAGVGHDDDAHCENSAAGTSVQLTAAHVPVAMSKSSKSMWWVHSTPSHGKTNKAKVIAFGMSASDVMFASQGVDTHCQCSVAESVSDRCCATTRSVHSTPPRGKTNSAAVAPFGTLVSDIMFARAGLNQEDDAHGENSAVKNSIQPAQQKNNFSAKVVRFGMLACGRLFSGASRC